MRFKRQKHPEFAGLLPRSAAAAAAKPAGPSAAESAKGRELASFYGSLVETTGERWAAAGAAAAGGQGAAGSSRGAAGPSAAGGTAQEAPAAGAATAPADAAAAAAAAAAAEPSHAGLGSAAAAAEQRVQIEAAQLSYAAPAGPEQQQPEFVRYGIAASNVGYRLLRKAGWQEGAGLGAQEQGVREPIQPNTQKGNLGLGYAPKPPPGAKKQQQAVVVGGADAAAQQQQKGIQQQQQKKGPSRPLPEDPLDKEGTEVKVKRVRQVLQAEADEKAGKAIQRYIFSAFKDQTGEPTSDSNPLLRRNHKLSATNPLL